MKLLICEPGSQPERERELAAQSEAICWSERDRERFLRDLAGYEPAARYDCILAGRLWDRSGTPGLLLMAFRRLLTVQGRIEFLVQVPPGLQGEDECLRRLQETVAAMLAANYADAAVMEFRQAEGAGHDRLAGWRITLSKYDAAGRLLRQKIPGPERRLLLRYLHRVGNDIDVRQNSGRVWSICEELALDFDTLRLLIDKAMVYPGKTLKNLAASVDD